MRRVICVCGARPNFMKIAPVMRSLEASGKFELLLVHTGQHYDANMSKLFFDELGIPEPDVNLEVGSASHAEQTAEIMKRFEPVVKDFGPDYVVVVGDVNSTIACGLVAVKLGVRLAHVEAGLRSFDRRMPEEINRLLTDQISDLLFVTEESGVANLKREGIDEGKIHFVGNVMIDTLLANRAKAKRSPIVGQLGLDGVKYGVITLHRPSNVDDPGKFAQIVGAFEEIQKELKLVFPMHPRTRHNLMGGELAARMERMENLKLIEPVGYLDFLRLMSEASVVITDSGGIQEETTILQVPCMTLRENTERPVTISEGTNRLVDVKKRAIVEAYKQISSNSHNRSGKVPRLWDGRAAERIAEIMETA